MRFFSIFWLLRLVSLLFQSIVGVFFRGSSLQQRRSRRSIARVKVRGTVVLMKKNLLNFTDLRAWVLDHLHDCFGKGVSFQLVSSTIGDQNNLGRGVIGKQALLEGWGNKFMQTSIWAGEWKYSVTFEWSESEGVPGAVIVENNHHSEFYLKSLTLEDFPERGRIHFPCNSWVYPVKCYTYVRVFFTNNTYLPCKTPASLQQFRKEELIHLRGDHVRGQLQKHDRVYGYAFYNDLGQPEKGPSHARPVLGGQKSYPYPRRGRTSRPPNRADPNTESRLCFLRLDIYIPRDERFYHIKLSDFLSNAFKALVQSLLPLLNTYIDSTPFEFDCFEDILRHYEEGHDSPQLNEMRQRIPFHMIKDIVNVVGNHFLKLPLPQVIQEDKSAWRTDDEFGREMLAGVNPVLISRLKDFPPTSKLDSKIYGNHKSTITASHIEPNLEGYKVDQALSNNRLFILDHHDTLIPYLNRINTNSPNTIYVYATRTVLFLRDDSTLKPLAIELSFPHPQGEEHGAISKVYTPSECGVQASIWQLAKAYVAVNDSGIHQLICHWLNTHAVIEPFVIATNRQLSVMHPIHKLLSPHYRDTMNINALARQTLINAGGVLEYTVFPGKYALEMSSVIYRNWKLTDHALPVDLLKRGVAVEDKTQPNNIRLLIEDYPYAVDGLQIWSAIESWVNEYCSIYYADDDAVKSDEELQAWWTEIREVGHGDLKDETWWPTMQALSDLTLTCTTIMWIASALHAAVNFGQYPFAGFLPNRPTISRRSMPEPGSAEYEELKRDPERVFLKTITSQLQTIVGVSLIEVLSKHSSNEIYLGQRDTEEWTADEEAVEAFKRFGDKLIEIENRIVTMNKDSSLKNRNGPVKVPYMLLYPNTSDYMRVGGLSGKGIPNSISI